MKRAPLVILTGPTAVGKSALAVQLAHRINGEIISADSMQVYRGMDIGSAKIREDEMEGIRHYLIDVLDPDEPFHVVRFQQLAREAIREIITKGKVPVLTGGTGFYIQSVLYDISFEPEDPESVAQAGVSRKSHPGPGEEGDQAYRHSLEALCEKNGSAFLHRMLEEIDPLSASAIHENNVRRVIRALEYFHETGELISEHNRREKEKTSPYRYAYFVLNDKREAIYERINARVDAMMREGLLQEVERLREKGFTRDMVSMQGLGYKEILDYLDGSITLDEAVYRIKRDSRHFAKRQLTWFRREKDVIWINRDRYSSREAIMEDMISHLVSRKIISPGV